MRYLKGLLVTHEKTKMTYGMVSLSRTTVALCTAFHCSSGKVLLIVYLQALHVHVNGR